MLRTPCRVAGLRHFVLIELSFAFLRLCRKRFLRRVESKAKIFLRFPAKAQRRKGSIRKDLVLTIAELILIPPNQDLRDFSIAAGSLANRRDDSRRRKRRVD